MAVTMEIFRNETDAEHFASGETVFREGESGEFMYVVLEGEVEARIRGTLVETVGPGGIVGEMALIDGAPRVATVTAKTDTKLAPIGEKRFLFLVEQTPRFSLQIMRLVVDRVRRTVERL
jgi:CRP/FNR family cyclic AMP-dependent transcriptional regulator